MSDLIRRQDAIEAIRNMPVRDLGRASNMALIGKGEAIVKLYTLPSAEAVQRWIPCSERLPNEKGMYLVTSRKKATAEEFGFDLDDVEVKKMRFDEDGWRIPKHIPEWINGVIHTTVLAWMPLPTPYQGGDDK